VVQPQMPPMVNWRLDVDVEKIAWLTIDTPNSPVNTLSRLAISELETAILRVDDLVASGEAIGLVIQSGKESGFIAGADVSEFGQMADPSILPEALRRAHAVMDRIESLKAPVVAAIHGFCLGGGFELALACHYRVAVNDEKTRVGFPEVNLGIFPGFGGTGRSIRQAGPVEAMQAMLTGRMIKASSARRMGIVDKLVPRRDTLHWEARKAVLQKRRSSPASLAQRLFAWGPIRPRIVSRMRAEASKKAPRTHYPAPHSLIDLFEAHGDNWRAMIDGEASRFAPLLATDTARNLRRVFFLSEGLKKQGLRGNEKPVFRRVHVVGAGVMGGDIAAWCALRGLGVTLQDLDMERIAPALVTREGALQETTSTIRSL